MRIEKGFLAKCPYCNRSGANFTYCLFCKKDLPDDVEKVSSPTIWCDGIAMVVSNL